MAWTDFPCKEWEGYRRNGYGRARRDGRFVSVHRWTWEQQHGPLPRSILVLHHCDNPACYEIEHLFLGTQTDNMRDMVAKGRGSSQLKTHCPKGHLYDDENTRIYAGRRNCRQCDRDRRKKPTHQGDHHAQVRHRQDHPGRGAAAQDGGQAHPRPGQGHPGGGRE